MKKIIAAICISLLLFMSSAHSIPSNFVRHPSCHDDVTTLPIFELSAKRDGNEVKHGSTFLVDQNLWATAYHVVSIDDEELDLDLEIILPDGSVIPAIISAIDLTADIAILTAPSGNMTPLNKMSKNLKAFEPVWNVGVPGLSKKTLVSFEGVIMNVADIFLMSSAIAFTGMSGGPQFRCNGDRLEVIAVIIKTSMRLFQTVDIENDEGIIEHHRYYQIQGSQSSPHIAGLMIEIFTNHN